MKKSCTIVALVVGAAGLSVPVLVAFSAGAEAGRSGGPAGYDFWQQSGQPGNCTACHMFNSGPGGVELLGAPRRYRAGASYDLTVRIGDPEQAGAGFEISAEGPGGHVGAFNISDSDNTRNAGFSEPIRYVTHTRDGYDDSLSNWDTNGGSYEYHLHWEAPAVDEGSVVFFVAGNAVDDSGFYDGDRYYATHAIAAYAEPGDGDGDTDLDLRDFAVLQRCFNDAGPATGEDCEFVDFDDNGAVSLADTNDFVSAMTGPTAALPAGYVLADAVRGGLLYDKWWKVNGAPEPTGDHPLWAFRPDMESNTRTGSATWRCKECHGWDYKGRDGVYGSGSHRTGIGGVISTTLTPQQLFDLLKADDPAVDGHDMDAGGMSDRDHWDLAKMTLDSVIDTDLYIDGTGTFAGDMVNGTFWFNTVCARCHGFDGTDINFHTDADPEYVGTVAAGNPWEFLHKVRFGHPGAPMPSLDLLGWSVQRAADIGMYAATLPQ